MSKEIYDKTMKKSNGSNDEEWSEHLNKSQSRPDIAGIGNRNHGTMQIMMENRNARPFQSNKSTVLTPQRHTSNLRGNQTNGNRTITSQNKRTNVAITPSPSKHTNIRTTPSQQTKHTNVAIASLQGKNTKPILTPSQIKKVKFSKDDDYVDDLIVEDDKFWAEAIDRCEKQEIVANKVEYCHKCENIMTNCDSVLLGKYSSAVVLLHFNHYPADMNPKKCVEVFCKAYNRALDFEYFCMNRKLIKKAFYYPPACVMDDLEDIMFDIETMQQRHLDHVDPFQRSNSSEFEKHLMTKHAKETHIINKADQSAIYCGLCGLKEENCHGELFHEYCAAHVYRNSHTFPTAMTYENCRKLYVKKYNSAMNYYYYKKYTTITLKTCDIPCDCLHDRMIQTLNAIEADHVTYVNEVCGMENAKEWRHANMDLFGFEIDLD